MANEAGSGYRAPQVVPSLIVEGYTHLILQSAKQKPCLHNPGYDCWEYVCSGIQGLKFHCYLASQIKTSEFAICAAAQAPQQSGHKIDLYQGVLEYDQ